MDNLKTEQLFEDLFYHQENERFAVMYLASLMSEPESEEDFQKRLWHLSQLREFFNKNISCPKQQYYLRKVNQIEEIIKGDKR